MSSNGAPQPDSALKSAARKKILHYHQLYANLSDPIVVMSVVENTSGRLYDDVLLLIFFHAHRETSALAGELRAESETDQKRNLISFAFCTLTDWLTFRPLWV